MKIYVSVIACICIIQFSFCQSQDAVVPADFTKLSWLAGEWNRTNTKPGQTGHERWTKKSASELSGWGITMKGSDTAFVEKLHLLVKDNQIFYVAETTGNNAPVYFKMISITSNGFDCENPAHDFPKKISYQLQGNNIKATISGNGKSIDYIFKKKEV